MSENIPSKPSLGIIGGGVIGLCSAYILWNDYDVTVIDESKDIRGASRGNAGTICLNLPVWLEIKPW